MVAKVEHDPDSIFMTAVQGSSANEAARQPGVIQGLSLVLPVTTAVMGSAILAPNIPQMITVFGDIPAVEFWVPAMVTVPALCLALFSPLAGAVADVIGRRRIMIWAMLVYGLVGMLPLVLQNFWVIFASRIVVGMMEAILLTSSTVLIGDYFSGSRRAHWLAMQTTTASASSLVMFPLGGFVGQFGWQYPFAMYGFSLALVVLLVLFTWEPPESERLPQRSFSWSKMLALLVVAVAATWAISRFAGWLTPIIVYALCLVVMLAISMILRTDPTRVRSPSSSWASMPWLSLTGICAITAIASIMFYLLQILMGRVLAETGITDPLQTGIIISAVSSGIVLGTIIFSRISRTPVSWLLLLNFSLIAIGFWGMSAAGGIEVLLVFAFINQLGCGLVLPTLVTWAMRQFTFAQRGRGIGIWQSFFTGGQFVGPAFVTWLAVQLTQGAIKPSYAYVSYAAAALAAGALLAILMKKGVQRVVHEEEAGH